MYMFSLQYWLGSSASTELEHPTEKEQILDRLCATGPSAFADQETLMLSWSTKSPSIDSRPEIIAQLAKNMAHQETSLTYKILCTLWISKLDPDNGHDERAKAIHDLLNSGDLDSQSADLFRAFAHELSQTQWIAIQERLSALLNHENSAATMENTQAILILGIAYPHVTAKEQKQILYSLYSHFNDTDPVVQQNIAESIRLIYTHIDDETDFEDALKDDIINHCSVNNHAVGGTGPRALALIIPRTTQAQQKTILRVTLDGLQKADAFTIRTDTNTACACFMYADQDQRETIIRTLAAHITHAEIEFRNAAADGFEKIYPLAAPAHQKMIISLLEQSIFSTVTRKQQIAQTLKNIHYEKTTQIQNIIDRTLKYYPNPTVWNGKASAAKRSTNDELRMLSYAERNVLVENSRKESVDPKVHDHLMNFCAKTFKDVDITASVDKKARSAMSPT